MVRCERYSSRMTTRLAKLSGLGLASRPAYSSLRREAAAQAAYRRARRLQAGLSARPVSRKSALQERSKSARLRAWYTRDPPSSRRLRLGLLACL